MLQLKVTVGRHTGYLLKIIHDTAPDTCGVYSTYTVSNDHAGTLPSSWGDTGAWPALTTLNLYELPLCGTLPTAWGGHKTFPALLDLRIGAADTAVWHNGVTQLSGSLPPQWGSNGSLERLEQLWIANLPPGPGLSGSLPPEWGSPVAWQNLQYLVIANTQGGISGTTFASDAAALDLTSLLLLRLCHLLDLLCLLYILHICCRYYSCAQ